MNTLFLEKLLEAKRLEAEAVASLVPYEARIFAAAALRACSSAVIDVLEDTPGTAQSPRNDTPFAAQSATKHTKYPVKRPGGLQPIVIE